MASSWESTAWATACSSATPAQTYCDSSMIRCFSLADSSAFLATSSATDARCSTLAAAAIALPSHSTAASRAVLASAASRSISRACASACSERATTCDSAVSFSAAISAISSRSSVCFLSRLSACSARATAEVTWTFHDTAFSSASDSSRSRSSSSVRAVTALPSQSAEYFLATARSSVRTAMASVILTVSRVSSSTSWSTLSLSTAIAVISSSLELDDAKFVSAASYRAVAAARLSAASCASVSALFSTSWRTRSAVVTHTSAASRVWVTLSATAASAASASACFLIANDAASSAISLSVVVSFWSASTDSSRCATVFFTSPFSRISSSTRVRSSFWFLSCLSASAASFLAASLASCAALISFSALTSADSAAAFLSASRAFLASISIALADASASAASWTMRSISALATRSASSTAFLCPLVASRSSTFFSAEAAVTPSRFTAAAASSRVAWSCDLYDVTSALTDLSSSATSSRVFCCLASSASAAAFSFAISSSSSFCRDSSCFAAASVAFSDSASFCL
mmetsp:Transcript_11343/g.51473  ORF Transcript_11343/g.51473 Transcript_11343/m.51473 type:complete len:522 (-) Transcript_11343:784-2349(-)